MNAGPLPAITGEETELLKKEMNMMRIMGILSTKLALKHTSPGDLETEA